LWQPLLQHFLQLNRRSIKQGRQHLFRPQLLPQPLLQPQPASAPQLGAAAQLGAAQAGCPQPLLQHFDLQQWPPRMPLRFNPQQRFLQQPLPQPLLQPLLQAGAAPQLGSAPQVGAAGAAHVGAAGAAHVGAAGAEHAGAAQAGAPQLGREAVQQLVWQPQPFAPSIRSSRSKPKLCEHRPKPSTKDPRIMFHFI